MTSRPPFSFPRSRGIVSVAFGKEYANVAAASAQSVRQHCDLPIHVFTNVDVSAYNWPAGVTFTHCDMPDEDNRIIRTQLYDRTPFERTLLLDADVWITSDKIGLPFDYLDDFDACFVSYEDIGKYKDSVAWKPILEALGFGGHFVLAGGAIWFKRTPAMRRFWKLWHRFWQEDGASRDMPALFRAVWKSSLHWWPLSARAGWLGKAKDNVIRHQVSSTVGPLPSMTQKLRPDVPDGNGGTKRWTRVKTKRPKPPRRYPGMPKGTRPSIAHVANKFKSLPPRTLIGAEVGVYEGDHAAIILTALHPDVLYLVDPWNCYDIHGKYGQWMRRVRGESAYRKWTGKDWEAVYAGVTERFRHQQRRVKIRRAHSNAAASVAGPATLHFAYIDGSHEYGQVMRDLDTWWTRIMPGGVLCGHDYDAASQAEVVMAVDEWGVKMGLELHQAETDFWFDKPKGNR